MKIRPFSFFIALSVLTASSSIHAFEYFEDFERYKLGIHTSSEYNVNISSKNPVIFSSGFSSRLVSLDDRIQEIDEVVPNPPKNPKIVKAAPSGSRTGDCINCAMRFVNKGSLDLSKDSWSEQRFSLNADALQRGEKGLTNLWLQYDQYIPKNYHHRGTTSRGGRKVLAIFSDGYSISKGIAYPTFIIGGSPRPSHVKDASYIDYNFQTQKPGEKAGDRRYTLERPGQVNKMLINPNIDLGHWQRRTLHLRMPTAEGANDGVIEFWVQRLAETENPMAAEKLLENNNGNFYGGSRNYVNKGYLLGYSNAGYNYDVSFLFDNLILSDDVYSIDGSAIGIDKDENYPPNVPSSVTID